MDKCTSVALVCSIVLSLLPLESRSLEVRAEDRGNENVFVLMSGDEEENDEIRVSMDPGAMLEAHNIWRRRYGVPPLKWSPELARYGQAWADRLLREGRFEHRPGAPYGENLATASGRRLSPADVVDLWAAERKNYNHTTNTCASGAVCGHFTQVVWKNTREVGCGLARGEDREVWVCNYDPPGNIIGSSPY